MIACLTYAAGTHTFKFNEYMLFKWLPTAHMLISADEVLYTNINEDCSGYEMYNEDQLKVPWDWYCLGYNCRKDTMPVGSLISWRVVIAQIWLQ